jgi:hypothetical protein
VSVDRLVSGLNVDDANFAHGQSDVHPRQTNRIVGLAAGDSPAETD